MRCLLVPVLALGVTAGCASSPGDEAASPDPVEHTTSDPEPAPAPSSTETMDATEPDGPSTSSPTAPVADGAVLADQFVVFLSLPYTDGPCSSDVVEATGAPRLDAPPRLTIGRRFALCFVGFDRCEPVTLAAEWPGGRTAVDVVFDGDRDAVDLRAVDGPVGGWPAGCADPEENGVLWVEVGPGTPRGEWTLTATQGSSVTTLLAEAGPASSPGLERTAAPAPDTVRYLASGFPPGETPVGLYRLSDASADGWTATLERELPSIDAGEDGAAVIEVDVGGLGPGQWCIDTAITDDDSSCDAVLWTDGP